MARSNRRVLLITALIVATVAVVVVVAIVVPIATVFLVDNSEDRAESSDSFKLHVNPLDPIIMSVETSEGDTIYMLGNKTSDGLPQSINEFHIENGEETTYVKLDSDGLLTSAINNDGLQMDLFWNENFTMLHISLVLGNGSEQVSVNIDLDEPVDNNFTDFEEAEVTSTMKRSVPKHTQNYIQRIKRQSDGVSQNFANIAVSVESCSQPESDAIVYADVLLDYDQDTGSHGGSVRYSGIKTQLPGTYHILIPTSKASDIGDMAEKICDKIEMILGKVCDIYSKTNDFVRLFSKHEADSVICFLLGRGLQTAFPALRVVPVYRFCKTAFKGLKSYCKYANKDLGNGFTPANLVCDALPLVDNGVDILRQTDILFTPSAIFPQGNRVTVQGRVLSLPPGFSSITDNDMFTVENDQSDLSITQFIVQPFDPVPDEDYAVTVSYKCYSSNFRVHMSIIGTDSYTDSTSCFSGPSCVLHVPGAEALVRDLVTVTAQDTSVTIVRRIIILF